MTTGRKISEFNQLNDIAGQDILLAVDVSDTTSSSAGTTKKVLFSELKGDITSGLNITNWDTAYSWGNHATAGYLTSFTETDPVFTAHPAHGITSTKIGQWDAAYGWGNHAVQGYLQSIAAQSINALNDVEINSETLATDQVIKWNGTSWVNGTGGGGTTINGLNDVGDVTITSASLADNQILRYDSGTEKWRNETFSGISLTDLSVTTATASSTPSLTYNSGTGVFTYTPPSISSFEVVDDTTPQLGGDLDLNSNDVTGTGDINISGEVKGNSFNIKTNNATIAGTTGANRDIKVIGGAPFYYDGTAWREFYLIDGSVVTIQPDTDWGNVMIRSTFDSDIVDVRYNVTPSMKWSNTSTSTSIINVSAPTKVGVKSLRINGGAQQQSRLQYPMTSNYDFTGAWTMEAWVNLDSASWSTTAQSIFNGDGSDGEFALLVKSNGGGNAEFYWYNSENSSHTGATGTFIANMSESGIVGAFTHVALVRSSSDAKIRIYLNGAQTGNVITDNDIVNPEYFNIGGHYGQINYNFNFDGYIDDVRISKTSRYTTNFTAPTTQLPVTGSTTQIIPQPSTIQGEIDLGTSPTWKGTSGVTVTRQSNGVYRLTFTSSYSNSKDYYVIAHGQDQGFATTISAARSTGYVDLEVRRASTNGLTDSGDLAVQIVNHR